MPNILGYGELRQFKPSASIYVVFEGQDYHMALADLFSAISKTTVGLGNVDNTSDEDKPVSVATQEALDLKADSDSVISVAEFEALANSLSGYVTTTQLTALTTQINQALDSKQSSSQVSNAIQAALAPVLASVQQAQTDIGSLQSQITQLSQTGQGDVTTAQLSVQIGRIDALENSLSNLQSALSNHTHNASSISGLQVYVENIVDAKTASTVTTGIHDW